MKHTIFGILFFCVINSAFAQSNINNIASDNQITKAIEYISADSIENHINHLIKFYTRHNLSSKTNPLKGIGATADYLYNKASGYIKNSNGRLNVEKISYRTGGKNTRMNREVELSNIVATIYPGANKKEKRIIILLAHYDSRIDDNNDSTSFSPGANDNGSGVACLIEMVRVLSGKVFDTNCNAVIKCIFLSGEEHGLLGANYMAELAKKEGWNIVAVLNNDMIGNSQSSETNHRNNCIVRVFSENIPFVEDAAGAKKRVYNSAENDSKSRQLARYIKETGDIYIPNLDVKLVYRNDRFGRGGDHTPFCKNGFTAVRISEYHENYSRTHQRVFEAAIEPAKILDKNGDVNIPYNNVIVKEGVKMGDLPTGVDYEYVRKNTQLNMATALGLALAPAEPENVRLSTAKLSNYTYLSWEPCSIYKNNTIAGYYILMRETDQSTWQQKIFTTQTEIKLPVSKDNYFFAVQAVDSKGHCSLPVFAQGK